MKPFLKLILLAILIIFFIINIFAIDQVEDLIQNLYTKQFISYDTQIKGLNFSGHGEKGGMKCNFDYYFMNDGSFLVIDDSKLGSKLFYDGLTGYRTDYTNLQYPIDYFNLEVEKLKVIFISGIWLNPENLSLFDLEIISQNDKHTIFSIRFKNGVVEAEIKINNKTELPEKLSWIIYEDVNTVELKKYELFNDILLPSKIDISIDGELTKIKVDNYRIINKIDKDLFGVEQFSDTVYEDHSNRVEYRLSKTGMYVRPEVNDIDYGMFLLDTGCSCNVIDKQYAKMLDCNEVGNGRAIGVGGSFKIKYVQAESLQLGHVTQNDPIFIKIDLPFKKKEDRNKLAGILGFDTFYRSIIELNLIDSTLCFFSPNEYQNKNININWLEIVFCDDVPAVYCTIYEDIGGYFLIDTGYSGELTFNYKFLNDNNLLEDQEGKKVFLEGAGGKIPAYQKNLTEFSLGNKTIHNINASFPKKDVGTFSDKITAGIIGAKLLSKFSIIVFDYSHQRIGLVD